MTPGDEDTRMSDYDDYDASSDDDEHGDYKPTPGDDGDDGPSDGEDDDDDYDPAVQDKAKTRRLRPLFSSDTQAFWGEHVLAGGEGPSSWLPTHGVAFQGRGMR